MSDVASSLTPLAGGFSDRTFLGEMAGERAVVRVYPPGDARGTGAPDVDRSVLQLVRGLLPVPDVLDVRLPSEGLDEPGLLVTSWLPGERGDLVLPRLDEAGLAQLGDRLGRVAGALAGMPMLRPGLFLDADLALGALPGGDLAEWVEARLEAWPVAEREALRAVADAAQDRLDEVGRACLVHSDLNPKNVLVDPDTLALTGILDWEFAHAGHPWTDLGNLLRFDRHPAYVEAVVAGWADVRGTGTDGLVDGARSADLWALVDLAARAGDSPVADDAATLLRAVAATGDLHAWPFAGPGPYGLRSEGSGSSG